ncbi:MAG: FAD-dependent oxidoreductase [Sedimentitalea sp.]
MLKEGLRGQTGWLAAWRSPKPKQHYDFVIIGGGGHRLATAYDLAKRHRIKNIGVLKKGWLEGENTGRNTTVISSNHFYPESAALYGLSGRFYESLSRAPGYNLSLRNAAYWC